MKRRRLRPWVKYTILISLLLLVISLYLILKTSKFDGINSHNPNALSYHNSQCIIFYDNGMKTYAKDALKTMCNKDSEDIQVFDYTYQKLNDYHYYDYGQVDLLVNEHKQVPKLETIKDDKALMIISDHLRYNAKKTLNDEAYGLEFLENTYYKNLNNLDYTAMINGDDLSLNFKEYNLSFTIPLTIIGPYINIDLGIVDNYIKPHLVDPKRKLIAFSFDDGPVVGVSDKIIEELYKYDASASFYVVGRKLNDGVNDLIKDSIAKGNNYGSHTNNHPNLCELDDLTMLKEVNGPVDYFKANFNYQMNTYRPPYGAYDSHVDSVIPHAAILWTIDSRDWELRNDKLIYDEIYKHVYPNGIVIMHDIYDSSAKALIELGLIKNLINEGYQIVNIDEYATALNIKLNQATHLGWD